MRALKQGAECDQQLGRRGAGLQRRVVAGSGSSVGGGVVVDASPVLVETGKPTLHRLIDGVALRRPTYVRIDVHEA